MMKSPKIFPGGITGRQVRKEFMKCYEGWRKYNANTPYRSGEDDERSDQELFIQCVDGVYELYEMYSNEKTVVSTSKAKQKQEDAEAAMMIKDVAKGKLHAASLREHTLFKTKKRPVDADPSSDSGIDMVTTGRKKSSAKGFKETMESVFDRTAARWKFRKRGRKQSWN